MKYPADVVKVYPSRKIALLQKLIPACAVLLYQLLVAGISYRIFWYLFEWNYAMEVVNYYVDFDQGDFYFTVKMFKHIAFWSLAAVALTLFCLNMKRYMWNQVVFLCFAVALYLTLGTILFRHELALANAGGMWNVSADVPDEVRMENLRRNAGKGGAEAMYELGRHYQHGWCVKKDEAEAVKWFRLATEHGHAYAMYDLGKCYRKGTGVERNDAEAVKWYALAAEHGCAYAMYDLGECYRKGTGVERNDAEAVKWYALAAEHNAAMRATLEELAGEGNLDAQKALESLTSQK